MVCTMMGGREVQNAAEATAITELLGEPVVVGQFVEEPPCQPAAYLAMIEEREGRPCPRVELDPANGLASSLVMLSLNEHTRGAAQGLASASPRRQARVAWQRAVAALQSQAVAEFFNPKKVAD